MSTEPDILEALTELAEAKVGGPMPKCLGSTDNWGPPLSEIARRAKEEIVGLRLALETGAERIEALCDTLEVSIDPAGVLKEDGT